MRRRAALQYALLIGFFLLPLLFLNFGPKYIPLNAEVYIAVLVASILTGIPAAIFFVLALAMNLRRLERPVDIGYVRREHQYTAWAALLVAITVTGALATSFTPIAPVYAALVMAYALVVLPPSARHREFRVAIVVECTPQEAFDFVRDPRNISRYFPHAWDGGHCRG